MFTFNEWEATNIVRLTAEESLMPLEWEWDVDTNTPYSWCPQAEDNRAMGYEDYCRQFPEWVAENYSVPHKEQELASKLGDSLPF